MFMFWQVVPAILISMLFIGWGLPQTRFTPTDLGKQIDLVRYDYRLFWNGVLIIAITQGGRLTGLNCPYLMACYPAPCVPDDFPD